MVKQIDEEMEKRSECVKGQTVNILGEKYGTLQEEVAKFRAVLVKVIEGIDSDSENLEVYQYDFPSQYGKFDSNGKLVRDASGAPLGKHMDAVAMGFSAILGHDAELHLNAYSGPDPQLKSLRWQSLSQDRLDALLFHELTHLYGTEDDDSAGPFMNAHTMDDTLNQGTLSGNAVYLYVKHRAQDACSEEYEEHPE